MALAIEKIKLWWCGIMSVGASGGFNLLTIIHSALTRSASVFPVWSKLQPRSEHGVAVYRTRDIPPILNCRCGDTAEKGGLSKISARIHNILQAENTYNSREILQAISSVILCMPDGGYANLVSKLVPFQPTDFDNILQ